MIQRNPRYNNKRIMDPQVRCFMDEQGYPISKNWGLPKPNSVASYKSLAKYDKGIPHMDKAAVKRMNLAWEYTTKHFGFYMSQARILSYVEARERLDFSSSSGAPFNQRYKTKRELFEQFPEIEQWLEEDWERLATDENWSCLFTNSLKEEVRALEKMLTNSIRTFLAGGTDATVHGTRLFADMNEKFYASHLRSASFVGGSPYKGNWDELYQKLNTFSKGYALDESQYDSSLRCYMMWGCALFRWRMLRDEDKTEANFHRLRTYYRNLVNTLVVSPEGVIVMKKLGNPSGSVNTISDNTLILYTLMAYAWITLAPEKCTSYEFFEMHTAKALNGDDNTWTVSDEAHVWYNARSIIPLWNTIGITTTTDSLEPRKARDLDFLSARTVFLHGKAVPLYDRDKLMTSLLYAVSDHLTPATTLERAAGMLAIGWVDKPFRDFCRELVTWLLERYDRVLNDDPRWLLAKCQLQMDEHYYRLFMGSTLCLSPQMSGASVKFYKPDNLIMSRVIVTSGAVKPKRARRNNRRRQAARKGQATPKLVVQRVKRQRPRRNRSQRVGAGGRASGVGSTRTGQRTAKNCVVEEDEYVTEVPSSSAFLVSTRQINPGNPLLFPWLSKQAKQWEKYHFEYLEFYYKREVSEYAPNGSSGKVIMSVDFDANDPPPSSKQQMEDSDPHVDGMPCENQRLFLRANQIHSLYPTLFVRDTTLPVGNIDLKTYDVGQLHVATQGNANTGTQVGELRVRYRVRFSVPVLESETAAPVNRTVSIFKSPFTWDMSTSPHTEHFLWTATPNANPLGVVVNTIDVIPKAGNYMFHFTLSIEATSIGAVSAMAVDIQVNGTSIYKPTTTDERPSWAWPAATGFTEGCINFPYFFRCGGSDVITYDVVTYRSTAVPASGACNGTATLIIQSV